MLEVGRNKDEVFMELCEVDLGTVFKDLFLLWIERLEDRLC